MSDWSEDITLCFLEAYQNEPCIWNSKDINHKNRQKVNDAWTRIGVILNKNVKELKIKKEILMATFRRHFKKKQDSIRSGAGADDIYKPIWFAYDLMESFLGPVYTSTNNINTEIQVQRAQIFDLTLWGKPMKMRSLTKFKELYVEYKKLHLVSKSAETSMNGEELCEFGEDEKLIDFEKLYACPTSVRSSDQSSVAKELDDYLSKPRNTISEDIL
ncbi:hypothetical protein WA026_023335 [Henosepilachna vigintioctopunctata]|uniref:MADF domain-containing protein n=1 Tax=Henosepilachna vigintioctopunctata TaxID=420089 RepID=A0AAW1VDV5_9CUCU